MEEEKRIMKCRVCGAIFEEGAQFCPACGVGPENFFPFKKNKIVYHRDTQEHFLILGGGPAAVNAAEAIRERNATCSITMATDEPVLPYNRPMLTKALAKDTGAKEMAIYDGNWYKEKGIQVLLGKKARSIDPVLEEVVFQDDSRLLYSKCIYAIGSQCFLPPIPGYDKPQVITIRTVADKEKIKGLLAQTKDVVVIGGGVLGLEAAWALSQAGCKVTVLELAPMLMARQLDERAAKRLKESAVKNGVDIYVDVKIKHIEGDCDVDGVLLEDGTLIPAQMVIVSAGVRANVELARSAGIELGRAVKVNERMETNVPGIYACGDCAEYQGMNYAIWPQAVEMGKVAGANAAGDQKVYEPVAPALTFYGMGTCVYSIGDIGKDPKKDYGKAYFDDESIGRFETYYRMNRKLVGAILMGDLSEMGMVLREIMGRK